jgi:hypothetical protein
MIFSELIKRVKTRGNGSWISKKRRKNTAKTSISPPPYPTILRESSVRKFNI